MNGSLGTCALAGLVFLLSFVLASRLVAFYWQRLSTQLPPVIPEFSSLLALVVALLPALFSLIVVTVLLVPGFPLIDAHCHQAVCSPHGPVWQSEQRMWGSVIVVAGLSTVIALVLGRLIWLDHREARHWRTMARPCEGFFLLEHPSPIAFTLGLWRPRIFLSSGLLTKMEKPAQEVILSHEQAHARRGDNLRLLAARLGTVCFPRHNRRQLLAQLSLWQEQCCDRVAASHCGDRLLVADSLLRMARISRQMTGIALSGFSGTATEQRVKALLEPPVSPLPRRAWLPLLLSLPILALIGVTPLHYLLEWIF